MSAILQSMHAAIAHHQAGRLTEAEALYREVLLKIPEQSDALHLVGLIAHQQGRHEEATTQIGRAIQKNNTVAEYHNNLGAAERAAGHPKRAAAAFGAALKIDPGHEKSWINLSQLMQSHSSPEELRSVLDAWINSCPKSARAHTERASHRYESGDLPGAMDDHAAAASHSAGDPAPRLQLAILAHEAGDDARALAAFGDAHQQFIETTQLQRSTVQSKLDHDIEQIQWLVTQSLVPKDWLEIAEAYRCIRAELYANPNGDLRSVAIPAHLQARIRRWYNRPIFVDRCPAIPSGALNTDFAAQEVQRRFERTRPGITWADNLLQPEALSALRRFCMASTIWTNFRYNGGYVGTALSNGFANGLLLQIARELRERLPRLLGPHPLRQMWAFKYDQHLTGIGTHADSAAVNVNFWVTPSEANLDPQTGGLVVWRKCAPLQWDFDAFNRQPEKLMAWVTESNADEIHVPYRCNRAVIFDSNLVHRTGDLNFAPGYHNRRINITMLFGKRGTLD